MKSRKIESIEKIYNKKQMQINQEVTITDIVLRQNGISDENNECIIGEFNYKSPYRKKSRRINRIVDMITFLSYIVKEYHLEKNYVKGAVKAGHENHITRLLLHEFSLYTADQPLSIEQYHLLIGKLEEIAKKLPDNLSLLISSLPVIDKDTKLVTNQVIHVQCGRLAKIDTLAKISVSYDDPVYQDTIINKYTQDAVNVISGAIILPNSDKSNFAINHNGIISCETAGGAKFTTVIDICLDHKHGQGKKSLKNKIDLARKYDNDELFAYQVSHVITSNTVDIQKENAVVKNIVRADPKNSYQANTFLMPSDKKILPIQFSIKKKKPLTPRDFECTFIDIPKIEGLEPTDVPCNLISHVSSKIISKYRNITIIKNEKEINIKYPPFGPACSLFIYPPVKLEILDDTLKWRVDNLNEHALTRIIKKHTDLDVKNEYGSYKKISVLVINTLQHILNALNDYVDKETAKNKVAFRLFCQHNFEKQQIKLVTECIEHIAKLDIGDNFETNLFSILNTLKHQCQQIHAKKLTKAISQILIYLGFDNTLSYKNDSTYINSLK